MTKENANVDGNQCNTNENPSTQEEEKSKWYEKRGWVISWLIFFYPVGLYGLWKSSRFSQKTKITISAVAAIIFVLSIVSEESSVSDQTTGNPTQPRSQSTAFVLTKGIEQQVLAFEQKLTGLEKPALRVINQFTEATSGFGTEYSIYDLYGIADEAEEMCQIVWLRYSDLKREIPSALPANVKKLLRESVECMETTYFTKKSSFKYAKKFLDEQKPSQLQKFTDEVEVANAFMWNAILKLTQAKAELGMFE